MLATLCFQQSGSTFHNMVDGNQRVGLTSTKTRLEGNDTIFGLFAIQSPHNTVGNVTKTCCNVCFRKEGCRVVIHFGTRTKSHLIQVGSKH